MVILKNKNNNNLTRNEWVNIKSMFKKKCVVTTSHCSFSKNKYQSILGIRIYVIKIIIICYMRYITYLTSFNYMSVCNIETACNK